ncbi:hypothetical protein VTI74DRAFT_11270 [Chaetomium olivicolor]
MACYQFCPWEYAGRWTFADALCQNLGNPEERLRAVFQELDEEASNYHNSKVSDADIASHRWECTREAAQMVSVAWKCALAVYSPDSELPGTEHCRFHPDHVGTSSAGGTVKAFATTIVETALPTNSTWAGSQGENAYVPALVVAIRGSASMVDHMVNANARPRDANHFIDPTSPRSAGVQAHSGFLNSAQALDEAISQRIQNYIEQSALIKRASPPHILFTGHSAGGAVASLMYLRQKSLSAGTRKPTRFSCITFGAPPCVEGLSGEDNDRTADGSLCLNLVNEFDFVSRAQPPYILCMVNLLRSRYGQPLLVRDSRSVLPDLSPKRTEQPKSGAAEPHTEEPHATHEHDRLEQENFWPLSKPLYSHVGRIVILLTRIEVDRLELKAVEVPTTTFAQLLFCRLAVHHRVSYAERIRQLEKGQFNGMDGWP